MTRRGRVRLRGLFGGAAAGGIAALAARWLGWGRGERPAFEATGWERIPPGERPRVRARLWPAPDAPCLHWLGHSGFLLSWHGARILVDPHAGSRCTVARRLLEPPLAPREWPAIDAVLVSHAHFDHLDPRTLRSAGPREVLVPRGGDRWARSLGTAGRPPRPLAPGESTRVATLRISAVPARHHGSRLHPLRSRELAVGWVVDDGDSAVYFAGDTGWGDHFRDVRREHRPRVAILPIGAWAPRIPLRWLHLSPEEAVEAAEELEVETTVPAHFGTFRLSLDAPEAALPRFAAAAARRGLPWIVAPLLRSPRALVGLGDGWRTGDRKVRPSSARARVR